MESCRSRVNGRVNCCYVWPFWWPERLVQPFATLWRWQATASCRGQALSPQPKAEVRPAPLRLVIAPSMSRANEADGRKNTAQPTGCPPAPKPYQAAVGCNRAGADRRFHAAPDCAFAPVPSPARLRRIGSPKRAVHRYRPRPAWRSCRAAWAETALRRDGRVPYRANRF